MKRILVSLSLALLAASAIAASFGGDIQLRKLDRDLAIATYMGNANWFRQHLSDDYLLITSSGTLQTKAQLIEQLEKNEVQMEPFETTDVQIRSHGDTAIVTGHAVQKFKANGERVTAEIRYSNVWVRADFGWYNVSGQISPISIKRERLK
jgi:ketosteroid isomerase-like protein